MEAAHWQRVYSEKKPDEVSWYEALPERSLESIEASGVGRDAAILDVGGGASQLAAALLARGYTDLTVADISPEALDVARGQLGERAASVNWVVADVRDHDFGRQFDLWHDRALFHFMVDPADREGYLRTLDRSLRPGGHLLLSTFGPEGPQTCSGLPVSRYGPDGLSETLGQRFELASAGLDLHLTPSGKEQQFLHARLVARV